MFKANIPSMHSTYNFTPTLQTTTAIFCPQICLTEYHNESLIEITDLELRQMPEQLIDSDKNFKLIPNEFIQSDSLVFYLGEQRFFTAYVINTNKLIY